MTKLISGFNLTHHSIGSDVALFVPGTNSADFTNPAKMVDFMQYGSSGNPTESVAVSKGIWGAGDYVTGAPGYSYSGDGNQTGVQYWSGVSSVDEINKSGAYMVYPNPTKNKITIQLNKGVKLTSYQLVNAVGKVVINHDFKVSEEKIVLDVSDLVKGFYILILNDESESSMQQVIIE